MRAAIYLRLSKRPRHRPGPLSCLRRDSERASSCIASATPVAGHAYPLPFDRRAQLGNKYREAPIGPAVRAGVRLWPAEYRARNVQGSRQMSRPWRGAAIVPPFRGVPRYDGNRSPAPLAVRNSRRGRGTQRYGLQAFAAWKHRREADRKGSTSLPGTSLVRRCLRSCFVL